MLLSVAIFCLLIGFFKLLALPSPIRSGEFQSLRPSVDLSSQAIWGPEHTDESRVPALNHEAVNYANVYQPPVSFGIDTSSHQGDKVTREMESVEPWRKRFKKNPEFGSGRLSGCEGFPASIPESSPIFEHLAHHDIEPHEFHPLPWQAELATTSSFPPALIPESSQIFEHLAHHDVGPHEFHPLPWQAELATTSSFPEHWLQNQEPIPGVEGLFQKDTHQDQGKSKAFQALFLLVLPSSIIDLISYHTVVSSRVQPTESDWIQNHLGTDYLHPTTSLPDSWDLTTLEPFVEFEETLSKYNPQGELVSSRVQPTESDWIPKHPDTNHLHPTTSLPDSWDLSTLEPFVEFEETLSKHNPQGECQSDIHPTSEQMSEPPNDYHANVGSPSESLDLPTMEFILEFEKNFSEDQIHHEIVEPGTLNNEIPVFNHNFPLPPAQSSSNMGIQVEPSIEKDSSTSDHSSRNQFENSNHQQNQSDLQANSSGEENAIFNELCENGMTSSFIDGIMQNLNRHVELEFKTVQQFSGKPFHEFMIGNFKARKFMLSEPGNYFVQVLANHQWDHHECVRVQDKFKRLVQSFIFIHTAITREFNLSKSQIYKELTGWLLKQSFHPENSSLPIMKILWQQYSPNQPQSFGAVQILLLERILFDKFEKDILDISISIIKFWYEDSKTDIWKRICDWDLTNIPEINIHKIVSKAIFKNMTVEPKSDNLHVSDLLGGIKIAKLEKFPKYLKPKKFLALSKEGTMEKEVKELVSFQTSKHSNIHIKIPDLPVVMIRHKGSSEDGSNTYSHKYTVRIELNGGNLAHPRHIPIKLNFLITHLLICHMELIALQISKGMNVVDNALESFSNWLHKILLKPDQNKFPMFGDVIRENGQFSSSDFHPIQIWVIKEYLSDVDSSQKVIQVALLLISYWYQEFHPLSFFKNEEDYWKEMVGLLAPKLKNHDRYSLCKFDNYGMFVSQLNKSEKTTTRRFIPMG
ncbi:hypothetical protein MJO28_005281 [Puccinia striiformis f. sp. tritici]|uniref:Uncharacterized protein n=1 Tax=Puccinia striiformis f. sp. tritici TaxID=168172 RepID=A0ACC0EN86_9BASI|nr:hypothetical protein MJO28_005281 [Puccinia striiformis f. sp. tritici]